jgi:NADH dehydrogenase FAD-containing subunit
VAKQQGQYLAKLISAGIAPGKVPQGVSPFKYKHKGSLAYVGACIHARSAACTALLPNDYLSTGS